MTQNIRYVDCYRLLSHIQGEILQLPDNLTSSNDRVTVNVTKVTSTTLASRENDIALAKTTTPTWPRVIKEISKNIDGFSNRPNDTDDVEMVISDYLSID